MKHVIVKWGVGFAAVLLALLALAYLNSDTKAQEATPVYDLPISEPTEAYRDWEPGYVKHDDSPCGAPDGSADFLISAGTLMHRVSLPDANGYQLVKTTGGTSCYMHVDQLSFEPTSGSNPEVITCANGAVFNGGVCNPSQIDIDCPAGDLDGDGQCDHAPEEVSGPVEEPQVNPIESSDENVEYYSESDYAESDVETDAQETSSEPLGHDVYGTMYVTGTGGEGVHCRAEPNSTSAVIMTLTEGEAVGWVADGNSVDGWQGTKYGCYIDYTYLSSNAPVVQADDSQPSNLPLEANDSQQQLTVAPPVGDVDSQEMLVETPPAALGVTTLPVTGHGTTANIKGVDPSKLPGNEESMITPSQRQAGLIAIGLLFLGLPALIAWTSRSSKNSPKPLK